MTEPTVGAVFGPDELAEVEARAEKATEGPWAVYDANDGDAPPLWAVANAAFHEGDDEDAYPLQATVYHGGEADAAFIAAARTDVPRLAEALRSAWAERDQAHATANVRAGQIHQLRDHSSADLAAISALRGEIVALTGANNDLRAELKRATDRADLLNEALADAARHIGDSDALNRANAVLRADTDAKLSPRHRDAMGRPQYCDDVNEAMATMRRLLEEAQGSEEERIPSELAILLRAQFHTLLKDLSNHPAEIATAGALQHVMQGAYTAALRTVGDELATAKALAKTRLDIINAQRDPDLAANYAQVRQQRDDLRAAVERAERDESQAITERDDYHEIADKLADAIARLTGTEIGEHSSMNDPWQNALEAVARAEQATADARRLAQRLADRLDLTAAVYCVADHKGLDYQSCDERYCKANAEVIAAADRSSGRWAACRMKRCLDAAGEWDYESIPSERTDEWLAAHRFDLETALRLAHEAAPKITVNGQTLDDVLAWEASHRG